MKTNKKKNYEKYTVTDELLRAVKAVAKAARKNDLHNLLVILFSLPKKRQQTVWPKIYGLLCLFQPKVSSKLIKPNWKLEIGTRSKK